MKAAIVSEEIRTAGNIILLEIDEGSYDPQVARQVTKVVSLSGTVLTTDWGFQEGNREIGISNVKLTTIEYETLVGMQEDSTSVLFLFGYKTSIWKVIIENVTNNVSGSGYLVNITLSVISKYTDLETT